MYSMTIIIKIHFILQQLTSESALHRKGYRGKSKKQYDNNRNKK